MYFAMGAAVLSAGKRFGGVGGPGRERITRHKDTENDKETPTRAHLTASTHPHPASPSFLSPA